MAHEEEDARKEWRSLTTIKVASTREAREEVEPSMERYSVRTDRSPDFEIDVDSSYEPQIRQLNTCWKGNSKYFPMGPTPATGSTHTRRRDQNKSTEVSASFRIESC